MAALAMSGAQIGIGMITSAFHAHAARASGARNENDAMNYFLQGFDACIKIIVDLANKGTVTEHEAYSLCDVLSQEWSNGIAPYQSGDGRATRPCANLHANETPTDQFWWSGWGDGTKCDRDCTAGCCVTCNVVEVAIRRAQYVFGNGGGSFIVCEVFGNKYGGQARKPYTLTYTRPKNVSPKIATIDINTGSVSVGTQAIQVSAQTGIPFVDVQGNINAAPTNQPEVIADELLAVVPGGKWGLVAGFALLILALSKRG